MPRKSYALEVGGPRRLTVSWGLAWKRFAVSLDEQEIGRVEGGLATLKAGADIQLPDGATLRVRVKQNFLGPQLLLTVDGEPVPGSQPVPLPKWSYVFIVACIVIPVVSLGGAIPAAIGFGGAGGVAAVARDASRTPQSRLMLSGVICGACWVLFIVFATMVAGLRGAN